VKFGSAETQTKQEYPFVLLPLTFHSTPSFTLVLILTTLCCRLWCFFFGGECVVFVNTRELVVFVSVAKLAVHGVCGLRYPIINSRVYSLL